MCFLSLVFRFKHLVRICLAYEADRYHLLYHLAARDKIKRKQIVRCRPDLDIYIYRSFVKRTERRFLSIL